MKSGKIEPDEKEKMEEGYEYIKLVPGDSQSTLIYFGKLDSDFA